MRKRNLHVVIVHALLSPVRLIRPTSLSLLPGLAGYFQRDLRGGSFAMSGSEAGSYLRLRDSCITQLTAQGPSRTCNESKEEEEGGREGADRPAWREQR